MNNTDRNRLRKGDIQPGMLVLVGAIAFLAAIIGFVAAWLALPQPLFSTTTAVTNTQPDTPPVVVTTGAPRVDSYADVLEPVTPAVVSIYTAEVVRYIRRSPNSAADFWRRFFGQQPLNNQVREEAVPSGTGSGVIVSSDGYILTNNHVITNQRGETADEILVRLEDGRELGATVIGRDPPTDLAVLKINAENLPHVPLTDSNSIRVGDVVFAIGNNMGVGQTVTMGVVSATSRSHLGILGRQGYESFIQTDASINPGNSGGALVDANGQLIGINTAIISKSGGNVGLGLAIPTQIAQFVMNSLIQTGEVQRGLLGVNIADMTAELADQVGFNQTEGVYVRDAPAGMPANVAGLRAGDIITHVGSKQVLNVAELRIEVAQMPPGTPVSIMAIRNGNKMQFTVILADKNNPYSG